MHPNRDLLIFSQSYRKLLGAPRCIPTGTYSYLLGVTRSCSELHVPSLQGPTHFLGVTRSYSEPRVALQEGPTHLCLELLEVTWSCSELRVAPLQGHMIFARSYSEKLCCQLLSLQHTGVCSDFLRKKGT